MTRLGRGLVEDDNSALRRFVADEGAGLEPDVTARVFERFFRGRRGRSA